MMYGHGSAVEQFCVLFQYVFDDENCRNHMNRCEEGFHTIGCNAPPSSNLMVLNSSRNACMFLM